MKRVNTRVVINMITLEIIEEEYYDYSGKFDLCCGGSSGAVDWPDYMEDIHINWLMGEFDADNPLDKPAKNSVTMQAAMNAAHTNAGNPYYLEAAYNPGAEPINLNIIEPDSPLGVIQAIHDKLETFVDGVDPETIYDSFIEKAQTKSDNNVVDETSITASVDAFEAQTRARRLMELSRWAGGMADINAVHSGQFVIGMMIREYLGTAEVNRFERDLRLQLKRDRQQSIMHSVAMMINLYQLKVSSSIDVTKLQYEASKVQMIARQEQKERDLEIDVRDALWDLEVFQFGANLLASMSGAGHPNIKEPGKLQSALAGGLSGAAVGASVGGFPGAGIGFAVGTIGSLLT